MGAKQGHKDKVEAQIREWHAKIDVFEVRADKADGDDEGGQRPGDALGNLPAVIHILPFWLAGIGR